MAEAESRYVIVGAGLAGVSAAEALRAQDARGSILVVGAEPHLPYDRPPLSKKLWTRGKTVSQIVLHDTPFYARRGIALSLSRRIVGLDRQARRLTDSSGGVIRYERLLLAAGGRPRRLAIPGGGTEGICYFRGLDDYLRLREAAAAGKTAVVVGGGFIGSELAAALASNGVSVSLVFPDAVLCRRVLPRALAEAVGRDFEARGVTLCPGDAPAAISRAQGRFVTRTRGGRELVSDLLVVGIGIEPEVSLAREAGLVVGDGIVADEFLATSDPRIYAAGDLCSFPLRDLGQRRRLEHWDNASSQGRCAGGNMAGGQEPYVHMPYFFSDLFDFGYEAVGDVDSSLETFCDWSRENRTGVVYYLKDGKVRGVMLCGVWGGLEAARELIRKGEPVGRRSLAGAIAAG